MSWAEVKKINSNMGQAIDELLKSGGTRVVKSVQSGIISYPTVDSDTGYAYISPVDISKSVIIPTGNRVYRGNSSYSNMTDSLLQFVNNSTISAIRSDASYYKIGALVYVGFTVVEFY